MYANGVNLSGLIYGKAQKMHREDWDDEEKYWWALDNDFSVEQLGLHDKSGIITFASESKEEVDAWTLGAKSVMRMLQMWSWRGKKLA
jgi:hypothetical protein